MKRFIFACLSACLIVLAAACRNAPSVPPTSSPAYPAGASTSTGDTPGGYPGPLTGTPINCPNPPVKFDEKPLAPGATVVTGTGPANLPIVIQSIQRVGQVLGSDTIGADGRFSVGVAPLLDNDFVGVTVGDTTGTSLNRQQILSDPCYRTSSALTVPQVGFFFDTAPVRAK